MQGVIRRRAVLHDSIGVVHIPDCMRRIAAAVFCADLADDADTVAVTVLFFCACGRRKKTVSGVHGDLRFGDQNRDVKGFVLF